MARPDPLDDLRRGLREALRPAQPRFPADYRRKLAEDLREAAQPKLPRDWRRTLAKELREAGRPSIPSDWRRDLLAPRGLAQAVVEGLRRATSAVSEVLDEVAEGLRREAGYYRDSPYVFLLDMLLAPVGLQLHIEVRLEGREALIEALEAAFDDDVVEAAVASIDTAPYLTGPQKERLREGLRALRSPGEYWTEPSDRLLIGLDGALWQAAVHTEVVDPRSDQLLQHPRRQAARSKDILEDRFGLVLSESYRRFLQRAVFDRQGQRARHGRDDEAHRVYALLAAVGVLGWLAAYAHRGALEALVARLNEVVDPDLAAGGPDGAG